MVAPPRRAGTTQEAWRACPPNNFHSPCFLGHVRRRRSGAPPYGVSARRQGGDSPLQRRGGGEDVLPLSPGEGDEREHQADHRGGGPLAAVLPLVCGQARGPRPLPRGPGQAAPRVTDARQGGFRSTL